VRARVNADSEANVEMATSKKEGGATNSDRSSAAKEVELDRVKLLIVCFMSVLTAKKGFSPPHNFSSPISPISSPPCQII
jgi:hypothetical protein